VEAEARAVGRVQPAGQVQAALDAIDSACFPIRNLDFIYGLPGQSLATWERTLEQALARAPEELYLYPLYVRPLTGMARRPQSGGQPGEDMRLSLYRHARDRLLGAGYRQVSMRAFRRVGLNSRHTPYRCQADGMIGLGCGARSYTQSMHYSHRYAVGRAGIDQIIADFVAAEDAQHSQTDHGILLDGEDQRRRWVLKSLLLAEGLDLPGYRARFGDDPWRQLDDLGVLMAEGLALIDGDRLRLSARGLELSDAIGPWLYSAKVRTRMAEHPPG
jgi:oxygen-independent coproporphyrinogen III oxidase